MRQALYLALGTTGLQRISGGVNCLHRVPGHVPCLDLMATAKIALRAWPFVQRSVQDGIVVWILLRRRAYKAAFGSKAS